MTETKTKTKTEGRGVSPGSGAARVNRRVQGKTEKLKPPGTALSLEEMMVIASDIARDKAAGPTARLTALRLVASIRAEMAEGEKTAHGKNGRGPRVAKAVEEGSAFDELEAETEVVAPEAAASYRGLRGV